MRLGEDEAVFGEGDCVVIPPGVAHKLWNPGPEPLVLLCCCAPAYSDDDTVMIGPSSGTCGSSGGCWEGSRDVSLPPV